MTMRRPWLVATATLALAGFGTTAVALADAGEAHDREPVGAIELADASPESADSPTASPADSANTPDRSDPSPESADSPTPSVNDSPESTDSDASPTARTSPSGGSGLDSADSPATRVVRPKVESADSPARRPAPPVDSADSPWQADTSADSPHD
ncbi:hypothetical protein [Actinokineospora fastidiosa]|uniref:Uncharacterized protein n=1 Tax=Actinokineospora fastidiosa TaxID=1816 RepID=A0A918GBG0_9PSEU|nr:hypothetical protein [Actinokineospora fastidiosa]GGS27675.1 hypothetical protein GCM10010171_20560 [Actinokineospora fastidiosa]